MLKEILTDWLGTEAEGNPSIYWKLGRLGSQLQRKMGQRECGPYRCAGLSPLTSYADVQVCDRVLRQIGGPFLIPVSDSGLKTTP